MNWQLHWGGPISGSDTAALDQREFYATTTTAILTTTTTTTSSVDPLSEVLAEAERRVTESSKGGYSVVPTSELIIMFRARG